MEDELLELIQICKLGNRRGQTRLYERFSSMLYAVALRYTNTQVDATDVLQEAWVKIFKHLDSFTEHNSFEGWMRRIVINTAITHYRKNLKHIRHADIDEVYATPADLDAFKESDFTAEELMQAIAELPKGYGMVFQMYIIEGYKHKEIAEMLGIDLNTSKSQLSRARRYLQDVLQRMSLRAQPQFIPETGDAALEHKKKGEQ